MPRIEVVPNSTSVSAPGWAYVPDNGYDPSKVAIQPSGARKRAARTSGLGVGDSTTRQQNAVLKHLADLDKDSHRDVQIPVPSKQKDALSRGKVCNTSSIFLTLFALLMYPSASKHKSTQNVRRILISQKTFANHLADEEAEPTSYNHNRGHDSDAGSLGPPRSVQPKVTKMPFQKRMGSSVNLSTPTTTPRVDRIIPPVTDSGNESRGSKGFEDSEPLLRTYVPSAPSEEVMAALLSGPPLSYNGARAAPSLGKPQRHFCEICGYWGTLKCTKCAARVCGLECKKAHSDGRCIFYS